MPEYLFEVPSDTPDNDFVPYRALLEYAIEYALDTPSIWPPSEWDDAQKRIEELRVYVLGLT